MMKALINNIVTFSNVDGPGNRMAIFFQGCPFRCLYCHNPETIQQCIHCGSCVEVCPTQALSYRDKKVYYDQSLCIECDACIKHCPHLSDPRVQEYSLEELLDYVKKYQHFIEGVTVSGGECMLHADFLLPFFKEVKALGLTCLIDSNGMIDFKDYLELVEVSDGVMLDVKASNPYFHQEITGSFPDMVLENLNYLQSINKLYEVRTVILPGFEEENAATVQYVADHLDPNIRYKLIHYRPFGVRQAGLDFFDEKIDLAEEIDFYKSQLQGQGFKNIISL